MVRLNVDNDSGEIIEREPAFVKAYVEHISNVSGLSKLQNSVLWFLVSRMQFDNRVSIPKKARERFIEINGTSRATFANCISALAKRRFIDIEDRSQYFVNPTYFTKRNWAETRGLVAKWTFSDEGTEFTREIINEEGEVIVEAEDD